MDKRYSRSPNRNRSQSMGFWLNETVIEQFDKLDAYVRDLADSGYGIIRVMLRDTNFNHRSAAVVRSIGRMVSTAHDLGVKVVLDCEPHANPAANDLGESFPSAIAERVFRCEGRIVNGRFMIHLPLGQGAIMGFLGLESAFVQRDGAVRKLEDFSFEHRMIRQPYPDGYTTATQSYTEGRPGGQELTMRFSGKLESCPEGKLILYARFQDTKLIDFWSEDTWKYFDLLLERYRDIPLDGVGWDEPAVGGRWDCYRYGRSFAKAFENIAGYPLADKWLWLDEPGVTEESLRVRLDYYQTLNQGVVVAQQHLIAKAKELFGEELILGTHHTWQGEGGIADYRASAIDYFALNDPMDAGYTDCWWWDIKSVCYAYTLGSSLGRLTPSRETEINTWDKKPSNSRTEFQARLMTLMDVTWFNIWYGENSDCCLYPADYTWPTAVKAMQRHRDGQRRIGKAEPVIEVAMLHGWETVCGLNRADIASAHKAFCLNASKLLVDRNIAFDWMDTRLLADAVVSDGRLQTKLGSHSILVMPYASILPRMAWEKCRDFISAGGKVIFIGTPPDRDTDGLALRKEFAEIMGMEELGVESYLSGIDAIYRLPANRPEQLDVHYDLEDYSENVLQSSEGEAHAIRSRSGNAVFLSDLDPRERLVDMIEPWLDSSISCYADSILWRHYKEEGRELLICIATENRAMRGLIRWGDEEIEIRSGTRLIIERTGEGAVFHTDDADYSHSK